MGNWVNLTLVGNAFSEEATQAVNGAREASRLAHTTTQEECDPEIQSTKYGERLSAHANRRSIAAHRAYYVNDHTGSCYDHKAAESSHKIAQQEFAHYASYQTSPHVKERYTRLAQLHEMAANLHHDAAELVKD